MNQLSRKLVELNTIAPATGAKKKARRVGRGIGCGFGKTAGRGHKGQKSRAGGFHKLGFEGGQMPIQRRMPKRGFRALYQGDRITIRLNALNQIHETDIDLSVLKQHQLLRKNDVRAKVVAKGTIDKKIHLKEIEVTAGARVLIEKAGGTVTLPPVLEKVKKLPKKSVVA